MCYVRTSELLLSLIQSEGASLINLILICFYFFRFDSEQAGIMPLLDTDDMIMMKNSPDWKCVFCYVQSLYRHLNK